MRKALKIIGIIIICIVILVVILLMYLSNKSAIAKDYTKKIETGGDIEAKFIVHSIHSLQSPASSIPKTIATRKNYQ